MKPVGSDRKENQRLKNFATALETRNTRNDFSAESIIRKLASLNNQFTPTPYLQMHYPELIGSTELYIAYLRGDFEVFQILLDRGADYTLKNQRGLTILHSIVESMSKCSWKSRLQDSFIAAILKAHIENKRTANPRDPNGLSYFHAACMTNNVEAVEFFLDNGVSIDDGVNVNSPYFPGYNPLHFAVMYFSHEVAELLLKRGASICDKEAKGMTPLHLLLERNIEMIKINLDSDSQARISEARDRSKKVTRQLLQNLANNDTMIIDDMDLSCLHVASAMMDLMEVEELLKKAQNINHCINIESPLWPGYTALHFAAICNINVLKLLVNRGADLLAKNTEGVTPLDLCLERYKAEDMRDILSLNPSWKNIVFSDGNTKLLDAIAAMSSNDSFKEFQQRISDRQVISLPADSPLWPGFTPMHLVVLFYKNIYNQNRQSKHVDESYFEMVLGLFERNMKIIETQDIHGRTPLHLCFQLIQFGKMDKLICLLLKLYQKLDTPLDLADKNNLSLRHIAFACRSDTWTHDEVSGWLQRKTGCKETKVYDYESLFAKLLSQTDDVNLAYKGRSIENLILHGWTPLHIAVVKMKDKNLVRALMERGANVNAKDVYGITPIHLAVVPNIDYWMRYMDFDNILLSSPHLEEGVSEDFGLSHLHIACLFGNAEAVEKLVDHGADINRKIKHLPNLYDDFQRRYYDKSDLTEYANNTPLHMALKFGQKNLVIDSSMQRGAFKSDGQKSVVVNFLIQRGADVFVKNFDGFPLLYDLVRECNSSFLEVLRENTDLQTQIKTGLGPTSELHFACILNDPTLVRQLLNDGADVNATVSLDSPIWPGCTALHIFMHHVQHNVENIYGVFELLLDNGADVNAKISSQAAISPGCTPLLIFMQNALYTGKNLYILYQVLELLLDCGADVNATISSDSPVWAGCTALPIFMQNVHIEKEEDAKIKCDVLKLLLDNGADVNAKLSLNSRTRPGCTALHICVCSITAYDARSDHVLNDVMKLLIERDADVSLANGKQRTPLHMVYQHYIYQLLYAGVRESTVQCLRMMLRAIKDFSVNPASVEGITHFHIACSLADVATVRKFLERGDIDIDQPLDFCFTNPGRFKSFAGAGCTPLHLAVMKKNDRNNEFIELKSQLETVDLLLKHGADANAKNAWGETPFHVAICFELRERLARGGADVNAEDAKGQTALESLMIKPTPKPSDIIDFLRLGCRYNTFNSQTGYGCIGQTARTLSFARIRMQTLMSIAVANYPKTMETDGSGRTVIHNLVSMYQLYSWSAAEYAALIEQLTSAGCDIDDQDNLGRTALHYAVKVKYFRAVSGLLLAGADINLTDVNGDTAFTQINQFQACVACDQPTDAEDEQCEHYKVFKILAMHVKKLQFCGLDVSRSNENVAATAFPSFNPVDVSEQFVNELEEMEKATIGQYALTLRDFMSELDAVANYSTMAQDKRTVIDDIFLPREGYQLREKFGEAAGLLKLQYRKALMRADLINESKPCLDVLAGINLPDVCSHIILRFLTNFELTCLIKAGEN